MAFSDPHHQQQHRASGQYPPTLPASYGPGYASYTAPAGGYPVAQPYSTPPLPLPPPAIPSTRAHSGDALGWQILEALLTFSASNTSGYYPVGGTARHRVKVLLMLYAGTIAVIALIVFVSVVAR